MKAPDRKKDYKEIPEDLKALSELRVPKSVLKQWVMTLPLMQQALLCSAIRGPDGMGKYNNAKVIVRYLRGAILVSARGAIFCDGRIEYSDESIANGPFMINLTDLYIRPNDGREASKFDYEVLNLLSDWDAHPMHFLMHLIHSAQVIGYKHPNENVRNGWSLFYERACDAFHMGLESEQDMDKRMNL